ncbi:CarD family transcriptional regulator [bacterium]|nr:CarD family transcriptional regulator [bacterium]
MSTFKVGDKVVYPAQGVGVIQSIEARKIGTFEQRFYKINILENGATIMVPVGQVETVGLRRVIDTKTIEKVYDILRDRKITVDTQTWNRRYREYTQKLKTGSLFEIAKVIRDLSVLKLDKELSFGERKMLDAAEGLLVKEISIAKARTEDQIKKEIQGICHA